MERKSKSDLLSKSKFVKILKSFGFSDRQNTFLLGQAALISKSIEIIDFKAFLQKVCRNIF